MPGFSEATNCEAQGDKVVDQFQVQTRLIKDKKSRLVDLSPEKLCRGNSSLMRNLRKEAKAEEERRICEGTYLSAKDSIEKYRLKLVAACNHVKFTESACAKESNFHACDARRSREAAEANEAATALLKEAREKVKIFTKAAADAEKTYAREAEEIKAAVKKHEAALREARLVNDEIKIKNLLELGDKANTIRGGSLAIDEGFEGLASEGTVISNRSNEPTISRYQSKISGLLDEQRLAHETGTEFDKQVERELDARRDSTASLRLRATESERRASNGSSISGNNLTKDSTMSTLSSAMLPLSLASNLANQSAAAAGGSESTSLWDQVGQKIQNITGGGPAKSSFGEAVANGKATQAAPGENASVASRGDRFTSVSGGGFGSSALSGSEILASDTPGAEGRSLASTTSDTGGGGGAPEASPGKKKAAQEEQAAACNGDKNCLATLGLESTQFNKGGALGVPVVGASDPGLGTVGALDSLFGPMPGDDSKKGSADLAALEAGFGQNAGMDLGMPAGAQAAAEIGPAHSHSLFQRVHTVHEKALKKGTVSLFHKKL